jgi:hypothetical protein
MYICMYLCKQVRKYTYVLMIVHMDAYIYMYLYAYVYDCMHPYTHVSMHVHIYLLKHVRMYMRVFIHARISFDTKTGSVHVYVHMLVRIYVYASMYVCMYVRTYLYVLDYRLMYPPVWLLINNTLKICMYVYVCMYSICKHACMYVYMCMYIQYVCWMRVRMYTCTYLCVHMYVSMYVCMYLCIFIFLTVLKHTHSIFTCYKQSNNNLNRLSTRKQIRIFVCMVHCNEKWHFFKSNCVKSLNSSRKCILSKGIKSGEVCNSFQYLNGNIWRLINMNIFYASMSLIAITEGLYYFLPNNILFGLGWVSRRLCEW